MMLHRIGKIEFRLNYQNIFYAIISCAFQRLLIIISLLLIFTIQCSLLQRHLQTNSLTLVVMFADYVPADKVKLDIQCESKNKQTINKKQKNKTKQKKTNKTETKSKPKEKYIVMMEKQKIELRTHDPKVVSSNPVSVGCRVLEQGTLL